MTTNEAINKIILLKKQNKWTDVKIAKRSGYHLNTVRRLMVERKASQYVISNILETVEGDPHNDYLEYALYKGDEIIAVGTKTQIAEKLGIKRESVRFYGTPSYIKRTSESNGRRLVEV